MFSKVIASALLVASMAFVACAKFEAKLKPETAKDAVDPKKKNDPVKTCVPPATDCAVQTATVEITKVSVAGKFDQDMGAVYAEFDISMKDGNIQSTQSVWATAGVGQEKSVAVNGIEYQFSAICLRDNCDRTVVMVARLAEGKVQRRYAEVFASGATAEGYALQDGTFPTGQKDTNLTSIEALRDSLIGSTGVCQGSECF